jgi:hypothetical protein
MPSFVDVWAKYVPVLYFNGFREATSNAELSDMCWLRSCRAFRYVG